MEEIWKPVKGYEGLYEVSDQGRVRSIVRQVNGRGSGTHKAGGRMIKPFNRYAYIGIVMSKENKARQYYLHRVVAEAFIPNPDNKPEVNHIDGDKFNNNASNLEWVSHSENGKHAYKIGLRTKRGGTPSKKVRVTTLGFYKDFDSIADAANFFGISQSSISRCCSGERKFFKKIYKAKYL